MINILPEIISNIRMGNYRYIGSGSARNVFDLENGYVVKIAKNQAGIAQNRTEYQISFYDNSDLFARVIQVSDDFIFLIMEKAKKINNFSYICRYFNIRNNRELANLSKLQNIQKKYNLLWSDLFRSSSWGMLDGKPVIIDYGYTKAVSERYYFAF